LFNLTGLIVVLSETSWLEDSLYASSSSSSSEPPSSSYSSSSSPLFIEGLIIGLRPKAVKVSVQTFPSTPMPEFL
jgi:hypothetical protein